MKLFMFTALILASTAQARTIEKEIILCTGTQEAKGYKLSLTAKSASNVEGKAIAYWASLDQPDGIGYDGLIFGYKDDVMINLKPRRNDSLQLSGTIFMDEAEQVLHYNNAEGKALELTFACQAQ